MGSNTQPTSARKQPDGSGGEWAKNLDVKDQLVGTGMYDGWPCRSAISTSNCRPTSLPSSHPPNAARPGCCSSIAEAERCRIISSATYHDCSVPATSSPPTT